MKQTTIFFGRSEPNFKIAPRTQETEEVYLFECTC